ncbi:MAG: Asp-tRNA(Asn)/Glu-tRNA(Gln) amidotransferase subunit GatC [Campylobacterales bacterium]
MIDVKVVEKLEELALVEVEDKRRIAEELGEIVQFVEILNQLDLSEIPPTFSPLESPTPLREDTPIRSGVIEKVLENAPKVEGHFFIVPQIIE